MQGECGRGGSAPSYVTARWAQWSKPLLLQESENSTKAKQKQAVEGLESKKDTNVPKPERTKGKKKP